MHTHTHRDGDTHDTYICTYAKSGLVVYMYIGEVIDSASNDDRAANNIVCMSCDDDDDDDSSQYDTTLHSACMLCVILASTCMLSVDVYHML